MHNYTGFHKKQSSKKTKIMARINRGILGGFVGKVGNVVGSSWKGIETMRSLPISVLNPKTAGQIENRTRFSNISILAAACLTTIVKPLNDRFAAKMSGYNAFCQRSKEAFTGAGVFVPANLILSSGKLGDTPILSAELSPGGELSIRYSSLPVGNYQMPTDKAYILAVKPDGEVVGTSSAEEDRATGDCVLELLGDWSGGGTVYAYLSFIRADGSIVGNSSMAVTSL